MIDFQNASYVKLRQVNPDSVDHCVFELLLPDESVISAYKGMRDFVVFTSKRFIAVNVQGITGKKKDLTSMPYSKISVFSIETSGTFDIDSELEMYFSGVGKVRFEFSGSSDIIEIGRIISNYML